MWEGNKGWFKSQVLGYIPNLTIALKCIKGSAQRSPTLRASTSTRKSEIKLSRESSGSPAYWHSSRSLAFLFSWGIQLLLRKILVCHCVNRAGALRYSRGSFPIAKVKFSWWYGWLLSFASGSTLPCRHHSRVLQKMNILLYFHCWILTFIMEMGQFLKL